jgi:radical SAM superfamily enzyme YgiQ (UPF0313 family)
MNTHLRNAIERNTGVRRSPVNKTALNFMIEHMQGCPVRDGNKCGVCMTAYRKAFIVPQDEEREQCRNW